MIEITRQELFSSMEVEPESDLGIRTSDFDGDVSKRTFGELAGYWFPKDDTFYMEAMLAEPMRSWIVVERSKYGEVVGYSKTYVEPGVMLVIEVREKS